MSREGRPALIPRCPSCASVHWKATSTYVGVRCEECNAFYVKEMHLFCEECQKGHSSCVCLEPAPVRNGQQIKVVQKLSSGIRLTWEGPILRFASEGGKLTSVTVGDSDNCRTVSISPIGSMAEWAEWEIILPKEPSDKTFWACPDVNNTGKPAIWRRLDAQARGSLFRWFYPGGDQPQTWESVYASGPGYPLELKDA